MLLVITLTIHLCVVQRQPSSGRLGATFSNTMLSALLGFPCRSCHQPTRSEGRKWPGHVWPQPLHSRPAGQQGG